MAETGIFCSGAHVLRKAGAYVNTISGATQVNYNDYISQAESFINVATRYNWSDNYAARNADIKGVLTEAASNLAAIYCIQQDMKPYTTRIEAEDMISILYKRFQDCIALLKDQVNQTFMQGA